MGKAKDGSECYTRTGKGGGKYVTCEGTQKGGVTKKATDARKDLRKKVPEKKTVTKAQFDNARKKLAGGSASGKSKKPAPTKKKLGVKITPKPKNTIGGRPAGKRVDTGGARNVGKVVKKAPKFEKQTDPNSTGQKNLQALLQLGDLSSKIEAERQKLVNKDWYIVPINYLIGELYKKGLRDFKGTPLEGDGGRFGFGSTSDGWSVVYQMRGDKMVNMYRLNITLLFQQASTSFKKPSDLTDKEMLIDDIFSDKDPKATKEFLEDISASFGSRDKTFNVAGIKHLKDVNLSKDKWALKLGIKPRKLTPAVGPPTNKLEYYDFSINPWKNVSWADEGEKILRKATTEESKKWLSENKDKISKMTVKQLKDKYGNISGGKKADYVKRALQEGDPDFVNTEWSYFIKNGR